MQAMTFFTWSVWLEPMQIFEAANWDHANPVGLAYVASMFGPNTCYSLPSRSPNMICREGLAWAGNGGMISEAWEAGD